ncbi:hypothetical protein BH23PAT1_BH23PAT1_4680 [soil metagenome]
MMTSKNSIKTFHYIGIIWALAGISMLFLAAIGRMAPHALEAYRSNLSALELAILLSWSVFMIITEGYMGFQKRFAPRVAARATYLLNRPKVIDIALAPLFCMGYFHAPKKRVIIIWSFTFAIVLLVVVVRQISQPWRGIIDTGVIIGLSYGLVSIYYFLGRALVTKGIHVSP